MACGVVTALSCGSTDPFPGTVRALSCCSDLPAASIAAPGIAGIGTGPMPALFVSMIVQAPIESLVLPGSSGAVYPTRLIVTPGGGGGGGDGPPGGGGDPGGGSNPPSGSNGPSFSDTGPPDDTIDGGGSSGDSSGGSGTTSFGPSSISMPTTDLFGRIVGGIFTA